VGELGAQPAQIAAVLVGTGPGSYTGLRVGVATALGLARASGAPARGVASCEALCFAALGPGERACFLLDARGGGFYVARYRRVPDEVVAVEPPRFVPRAELAAALAGDEPILSDEASLAAAGLPQVTAARARTGALPEAEVVLALGLARLKRLGPEPLERIRPLYLR
jgi:tRNA threonylcarbamoyl adenosine modification protein YeaZ